MTLPAPVIERVGSVDVVRDDLLPGGTKMRALLPLMQSRSEEEFVYASPAYGYAQVALAHCAAMLNRRATVFTAKRADPHPLTRRARAAGAQVVLVPHGYLSNVQSKAAAYAARAGAYLVPFGGDSEEAVEAIADSARSLPVAPGEVWTVAGSGALSRGLQRAWPAARFFAVLVGKTTSDVGRAERVVCRYSFEQPCREAVPFPSSQWYDAKAWEYVVAGASPGALFWNVGA